MTTEESSNGIFINGRTIFFVVFVLLHLAIASQIYWLARDILRGDGSCSNLTVPLRYPPMRVPATPVTEQHYAENRLCADFALIYFQSLKPESLRGMYDLETTVDLWGRPSRYPPLMHVISSYTLCNLPYGQACLVHLGVQYLLFMASFIFAFYVLHIRKYLLQGILITNVCLFLTPVGLSFFERGQYTLYIGLCYLWLMLAFVTGKRRHILIAALFGFLKWTSMPFVFVAFAVSILGAKDVKSLKKNMAMAGLYLLTLTGLLLIVPNYGMDFIKGLFFQELELIPMGNSLVRIVPRYIVKSLPFVLVAVGVLIRYIIKKPQPYIIPFFAGSATLLVCYPTMSFDYSVPYLTAFIPFLVYWSTLPGVGSANVKGLQVGYYSFLLLASFALFIFNNSEIFVITNYIIAALALIAVQISACFRIRSLECDG